MVVCDLYRFSIKKFTIGIGGLVYLIVLDAGSNFLFSWAI